jgi:predicted nucleic acid-binding protein
MALILFDTYIFIDMLNGIPEATTELGHYDSPAISVITYMELRAGQVVRPQEEPHP